MARMGYPINSAISKCKITYAFQTKPIRRPSRSAACFRICENRSMNRYIPKTGYSRGANPRFFDRFDFETRDRMFKEPEWARRKELLHLITSKVRLAKGVAPRVPETEQVPPSTLERPVHFAKRCIFIEEHHRKLADHRVERFVVERQCPWHMRPRFQARGRPVVPFRDRKRWRHRQRNLSFDNSLINSIKRE